MAFGSITIGAATFNSIGNGLYQLSTVLFGQPGNTMKVTPGRVSSAGITTCAITRQLQKDVVENGVTVRKSATVSIQFNVPTSGFTTTEVDALLADCSTWIDATTLSRILMGES